MMILFSILTMFTHPPNDILTMFTLPNDLPKNLSSDNSKHFELWIQREWAVPPNMYYLVYKIITLFVHHHAARYQVQISDRKEMLTMDTEKSLYNCLQYLLCERIQFKALFYNVADQEIGSLTWK